MRNIQIGPHKIKLYDSINNIPPSRESLMSYYTLQELGVGHTWESIDLHLNSVLMAASQKDSVSVYQEIENLRLNYWSMANRYNPEHISWLCLIHSIDNEPIETDDESLLALSNKLGQYEPDKEFGWRSVFDEIKKKLPTSFEVSFLRGETQQTV